MLAHAGSQHGDLEELNKNHGEAVTLNDGGVMSWVKREGKRAGLVWIWFCRSAEGEAVDRDTVRYRGGPMQQEPQGAEEKDEEEPEGVVWPVKRDRLTFQAKMV